MGFEGSVRLWMAAVKQFEQAQGHPPLGMAGLAQSVDLPQSLLEQLAGSFSVGSFAVTPCHGEIQTIIQL